MRDHGENNKCFLMNNLFKHFDRFLNVIIVILGGLAVYHMFFVQKTPEQQKATLVSEAEAAFGEASLLTISGKSSAAPMVYTPSGIVPLTFDNLTDELENSDVPVMLLIYTSWCPYCNKLFPEVVNIGNERQGDLKIVAVSVDKDKSAFQRYNSSHNNTLPFPAYYLGAGEDYDRLINYLQLIGFNFKGGIPFMAFFSQGKPAGQIGGYVEKAKIDQMLQQIYAVHSSTSKPTL